ncbi:hypothetical protein P3T37_007389 [Kitasatospora sp. MAA4]|uniref:ATP-binding protein n=1 Tax=Kitasatospora sp. MAA4 TaxID=3035093 RepID=UPI002474E131|nr:helicase HerA-like domain-containing protein [Kitasatospora sp. MAA4]MDH6137951.1 hypothetical protein [Kitasatospora sp. MAA4]
MAAVVAAYHRAVLTGEAFTLGWRRTRTGGPVDIVVTGATSAQVPDAEGRIRLSYPPGGIGHHTDKATFFDHTPVQVGIDILTDPLTATAGSNADVVGPDIHTGLLATWSKPFAWQVTAHPIAAEEADAMATTAQARLRAANANLSLADNALTAEREKALHRDLRTAPTTGMWRITLTAAGETPHDAAQIAGLLAASINLSGLPHTLRPTGTSDPTAPGTLATSALLAALALTSTHEVPGLRLITAHTFDTTPETDQSPGIELGAALDATLQPTSPLRIPFTSLNRHTLVCGATGSGKSQTTRALLEAATEHGLPWLVVEPAKAEYRLMASRMTNGTKVIRIRPGETDTPPAGINPLEPALVDGVRYPLQTHLDLVKALFMAAFEAQEPFPQVLNAALTRCYEDLGWDLALGESNNPDITPTYPTLRDLQRTAAQVVDEIGYGKEVQNDIQGFIRVRIGSLRLGTTGRFFEGGHPLDFTALLHTNTVFEIEDVGDDRDKAFLMGTVIIRLVQHLRLNPGTPAPRAPCATDGLRESVS